MNYISCQSIIESYRVIDAHELYPCSFSFNTAGSYSS